MDIAAVDDSDVTLGRVAFGVLATSGTAWWIGVAASDTIAHNTLGRWDQALTAVFDVPLFIGCSAVAAWRTSKSAARIATAWSILVAIALSWEALVNRLAGWGALLMALAAITALIAASTLGISASEIRVLAMLREARGASVRPATISRRVLQTTGGLTATLRRLEADGRITRSDDPDDGRGKRVGLTDQGESFCDQVLTDLSDRYAFALRDLDLEESRTQVMQLIAALERFGNHPSSADWALLRTTTT